MNYVYIFSHHFEEFVVLSRELTFEAATERAKKLNDAGIKAWAVLQTEEEFKATEQGLLAAIVKKSGIELLVNKFIAWKLPADFNPDNGISFEPKGNVGSPHEYARNPVGTNLLSADQARQMIEYLLA
jgi:hypothetical protein